MDVLWNELNDKLLPQLKLDDYQVIADEFWELWNFPNCVGWYEKNIIRDQYFKSFSSLDGKHVALKAPRGAGSEYHNYKKFNSIVFMALCDAKYRFTYVDIGSFKLSILLFTHNHLF